MNRLTDTQEISNYLKLTYKHPWNISRKFRKDSQSRTRDIPDNLYSVKKWGNEHTKDIKEIWYYSEQAQLS